MIATTFDMVSLQKSLVIELNQQMLEAAEPIIQEALKRIEREMRQALAARLIGLIENNMSCERYGTDLRIVIKQTQTEQQHTTAREGERNRHPMLWDESGFQAIEVMTSKGPLQFVVYNVHNGFYSHAVITVEGDKAEVNYL